MDIIKLDSIESINKITLGTVIVVHNRLDLTRITIESYLFTTIVNNKLLIIDNASNNETQEYLNSLNLNIIRFEENKYPGYAINYGWDVLTSEYPNIEFLHRSDNDIFYRSGWDRYAVGTMKEFENLGQFGLLDLSDYYPFGLKPIHLRESNGCQINVHPYDIGGSFLIRREVWDQGVRHNEEPWKAIEASGGISLDGNGDTPLEGTVPEDKLFMQDIIKLGWKTAHSMEPIVCHLGIGYGWLENNPNFSYYEKSFQDRGVRNFKKYLKTKNQKNKFLNELF